MASIDVRVSRRLQYFSRLVLRIDPGRRRTPADLRRAASEVILLSRFFYIFVVFAIATSPLPLDRAYTGGPPTAPLWPIEMIEGLTGTEWLAQVTLVSAVGLGFALLAAIQPRHLLWRSGVFLYILIYVALRNSYGSINHGSYYFLYVAFALLFLPPRDKENARSYESTLSCLAVLWLVQTILLLPYTLSGVWKIWDSRLDLLTSDSMVRILLKRAVDDAANLAPLLPTVSQHVYLAQFMLLVTVYVELFALLVVVRPHLHRAFGSALILFHLGSDLIMNIRFDSNILMIGVFLVLSPTAPARFSPSGFVQSLPVIGIPVRAWIRRKTADSPLAAGQAWLVYDGECTLCRNYTRYLRVKDAVGELTLVDARVGGPLVEEIRRLPHDLNDGMVLKIHQRYYVGHEALNVLAILSDNRGGFSRLNRLVFRSPLASRLGYPVLKLGRRLLLKIKGIPPLGE